MKQAVGGALWDSGQATPGSERALAGLAVGLGLRKFRGAEMKEAPALAVAQTSPQVETSPPLRSRPQELRGKPRLCGLAPKL